MPLLRKIKPLWVPIVVLLLPVVVCAAPPMLTDDPGTPGNRKWEINIGANVERNTFEDRFLVPSFDLNYGLGERIQLKYEVPWVISNRTGDSTLSGPGNSVFGAKYRFLDEDKQAVSASVYPQVEFNNFDSSADRGLVDRGTSLLLPFEIQKQIGWLEVIAEAGYLFRRDEDQWIYGLLLGRKYDKIEVLAELHGTGLKRFEQHHDVVNFGLRWDFAEEKTLNASLGRSLRRSSDEDPSLIAYIGIQFRL